MKRVVVGALVAAALLCVAESARGQTPPFAYTPKVFTTVDAVSLTSSVYVYVTGIVEGEASPSTWATKSYSSDPGAGAQFADTCHRSALLVMAKPGQYRLEISYGSSANCYCKLIRVTP
jgi:hypothetical protein